MAIKLNGDNSVSTPGFTGTDTDTGLQCGTNELKLVTGGTARATVDSSGRLLINNTNGLGNYPLQVTAASDAKAIVIVGRSSDDIGELAYFENDRSTRLGEIQYRQDHVNFRHRVGDIRFATGGTTDRMKITSSGKVQITGTRGGSLQPSDNDTLELFTSASNGNANTGCGLTFYNNDGNGAEIGGTIQVAKENGSINNTAGYMRFSTRANNSTPAERMRITSGGAVRIGSDLTAAAAGKFQVVEEGGGNQANDCNAYFETNAQDWNIKTYYNRAGTHYHLVFLEQGTERGSISGSDGSNVTFNQGSDYRWKENIVEMTGTEGIEICKRLKPSKYNWIENREETGEINTVDGFIAHEVVEAGVLGAVVGEKDAVNEDGSIKGQLLDYGQMTPVLSAGIKGLIAKVETLETQNTAQQAQIDDLLARVTALEAAS